MNRSTDKRISFSAAATFALALLIITTHNAAAQTNTFPSSGNAGVGTTSPATPLDVRGTTQVVGNIHSEANASQNSGIAIVGQDSSNAYLQLYDSSRSMKLYLASKPGVNSYLTNGNFGIGTTSPTKRLEVLAADGEAARLYRNASTAGWGVNLTFALDNSAGNKTDYAGLHSTIGTNTAGAEAGNLFFTTATNGTLTEKMRITSDGDVGLGTASPGGRIDIRDSSGRQLLWNMSGFGHTFLNANGGNVHMAGNLYFNGTNWNRFNTAAAGGMWWAGNDGTLGVLQVGAGANPVPAFSWPFFINTNGYVGIGHINPTYRLDVQNGAVNSAGGFCIAGDCKTAWSQVGGGGSSQWTTSGSNIHYNTGNVGIGTSAPANPLEISKSQAAITAMQVINGSTSAGNGAMMRMFTGTNNALNIAAIGEAGAGGYAQINQEANLPLLLLTNNTERLRITGAGNVGIGTNAPASLLHVQSAQPDIALNHTNTANYSRLLFKDNGADRAAFQYIGSTFGTTARRNAMEFYNNYGPVIFYTDGAGNGLARVWIDTSGNVGIGASPNSLYKLDVAGNINSNATITGNNIVAKYQDLAEWVPASEQLAAGTVVVLDSTKSNQVISSSQSYDTRVAGVISAQPGITLGESGDGKVLVATTGRVRVKVDASRAPIKIGDLLVTSDVPGVRDEIRSR